MSFRTKILIAIFIACSTCTAAAVFIADYEMKENGVSALTDKSRAILSRLEVARDFIAEQGTLDDTIKKLVTENPSGVLTDEQKLTILKSVPIYASMKVGERNAAEENYKFRIFSDDPRNPDNAPTGEEQQFLKQFASDPSMKEIVHRSADGKSLSVIRPVFLSEKQGCLKCHGAPATSPWGNGKDVLGYEMENWKDGHQHGAFAVISNLDMSSASPIVQAARKAVRVIIFWGVLFTMLSMVIGFLLIKKPITVIAGIAKSLDLAGDQVAMASAQLAKGSEMLSSASTESAASLEETVASIEQLTSMVNRNADFAGEANALSKNSTKVAEEGSGEIKSLISSMTEIASSSREIENIIKVIDDIAFQTNLLALNAAVEAARAGEHGKGFAVVAEAVRNLAQQSAAAAQNISNLIKATVDKTTAGAEGADQSVKVLGEILDQTNRVSTLVGEMSGGAREQATSITQIRSALGELDNATQSNAATAEESAAASEELSAQAKALKEQVADLLSVLHGAKNLAAYQQAARSAGSNAGSYQGTTSKKQYKASSAKASRPMGNGSGSEAEKLIPLTDDDVASMH